MSLSERIAYINRHIKDSGKITVSKISKKFEVNKSTVKQDIEYMLDNKRIFIIKSDFSHGSARMRRICAVFIYLVQGRPVSRGMWYNGRVIGRIKWA